MSGFGTNALPVHVLPSGHSRGIQGKAGAARRAIPELGLAHLILFLRGENTAHSSYAMPDLARYSYSMPGSGSASCERWTPLPAGCVTVAGDAQADQTTDIRALSTGRMGNRASSSFSSEQPGRSATLNTPFVSLTCATRSSAVLST